MKIRSIRLRNFLSFGEQSQELKFSDHTTIVGPNDSGKTNVFRAIEYLGNLLRRSSVANDAYYYNRDYERQFEIEITVEFDNDELEAIRNFLVCSSYYETPTAIQGGDNQPNLAQLIQNVGRKLNSAFFDLFREMRIMIKSEGRLASPADILFKFSKNGRELYYYNYSFTRDPNP